MINTKLFKEIANLEHTNIFPNIIREYIQNIFLMELYQLKSSEKLLFKGGTALRIIYNSPRFSEDLDFSLIVTEEHKVKSCVENLFFTTLSKIENIGVKIEIDKKSGPTKGGYFGLAIIYIEPYPPINIEINISTRNAKNLQSEVDSITNNFIPAYTLYHLAQEEIVSEKIFGALVERKKPRDYYDLYFMLRNNMLSIKQKKALVKIAKDIIDTAKDINFQTELGVFLPISQQAIIKDFPKTLEREMRNKLSI